MSDVVERAKAEEASWHPIIGYPSGLVAALIAELEATRAQLDEALKDWTEEDAQLLAENQRLAAELETTRAQLEQLQAPKHPIGRCGDPHCGGDW